MRRTTFANTRRATRRGLKIRAPPLSWAKCGGSPSRTSPLGKLPCPRLHLFEQARVLDGDYDLVRKSIDELDLTFREWAHFGAPNEDHPNCLACVDQRDGERGAISELKRARGHRGIHPLQLACPRPGSFAGR